MTWSRGQMRGLMSVCYLELRRPFDRAVRVLILVKAEAIIAVIIVLGCQDTWCAVCDVSGEKEKLRARSWILVKWWTMCMSHVWNIRAQMAMISSAGDLTWAETSRQYNFSSFFNHFVNRHLHPTGRMIRRRNEQVLLRGEVPEWWR